MALPDSAVERIVNALGSSSDVLNMTLVNKSFAASTTLQLWCHISIKDKKALNALLKCLKKGPRATFPYPSYVKELSLYEFNPLMTDHDPTDLEINIKLILSIAPFFTNLSSLHLFFGFPHASIGNQQLQPFPYDAIASCIPSLRSLQIWNSYVPSPSLKTLFSTCTNLVRFDVAFFHIDASTLTYMMEEAKNLKNLHLNAVMGISNDELVSSLGKAPKHLTEFSYRAVQPLDTKQIQKLCASQSMIKYLGIIGNSLTIESLSTISKLLSGLTRLELEWSPNDSSFVSDQDFIDFITKTTSLCHIHLEAPAFPCVNLIQHVVASCRHVISLSIRLRPEQQQIGNIVETVKQFGLFSYDINGLFMFERYSK